MSIPYNFQTDWSRMAKLIVHDALKTTAGEQVLIHADPTYFPELTEQIRIELNKAGAVELATVLFFSPGLATVRQQLRRREDPTVKALEDHAMAALFDLADIYIWLPTIWSLNAGQTEKILETWKGRSIHFHWIGRDVTDSELFRKLSEMYDEALYIDYETLTARQKQLIETLRGCTVRITNPAGTDLTLEIPASAHFHLGNGDASKVFINSYARSARDREVELPAGAIRTIHTSNANGRLILENETYDGRQVGTLRVTFQSGRITTIETDHHHAYVQAHWGVQTGQKDVIGEFNIGVNPQLKKLPGYHVIPYFGYGDGFVRISLGDNQESGGSYISSFHRWLFLTDATLHANHVKIMENGKLV